MSSSLYSEIVKFIKLSGLLILETMAGPGGKNLIMNLLKNSIEKVENAHTEATASGSATSNNTNPLKKKTKRAKEKTKSEVKAKASDQPEKGKVKAVKKVGKKKKSKVVKGDEEIEVSTEPEPTWNLTKDRLVKIRKFRGETYVDIREYFMDKLSWEIKPGQKGVSLNLEQYNNLKSLLPQLDLAFPAPEEGFVDLLA